MARPRTVAGRPRPGHATPAGSPRTAGAAPRDGNGQPGGSNADPGRPAGPPESGGGRPTAPPPGTAGGRSARSLKADGARPAGSPGDVLVVGRVIRPHGVRGELVVDVRTDSPDQRFTPGAVLGLRPRTGPVRETTVSSVRPHQNRLLVFLDGILGRDAAESLRGALLTVRRDELPEVEDPEEFYDHQLEGLRAELADGTPIGPVTEVTHGPAGETLVVRSDAGDVLIPFVTAIVPTVDLAGGRLVVTPPDGLLDPS